MCGHMHSLSSLSLSPSLFFIHTHTPKEKTLSDIVQKTNTHVLVSCEQNGLILINSVLKIPAIHQYLHKRCIHPFTSVRSINRPNTDYFFFFSHFLHQYSTAGSHPQGTHSNKESLCARNVKGISVCQKCYCLCCYGLLM